MRACNCVLDPATETCSPGGTTSAPVCPGQEGGHPKVPGPVLTGMACTGTVTVPLHFDTEEWLDDNVHSPQRFVTYDPGVNLAVPILVSPVATGLALDVSRLHMGRIGGAPATAMLGGTLIAGPGPTQLAPVDADAAILRVHSDHVIAGAAPGNWKTGTGLGTRAAMVTCDRGRALYPSPDAMPLLQAVNPVVIALRGRHDVVFMRIPANQDHHQTLATMDAGGGTGLNANLYAWHGTAFAASDMRQATSGSSSEWLDLPPSDSDWVVAVRAARGSGAVVLRRAVEWRDDLPSVLNVGVDLGTSSSHPPGRGSVAG